MSNQFEDLSIFFKGIFSQVARLVSDESPLTQLSGILDREYIPMFDTSGQPTEGKQVTFCIKSIDSVDVHHGDKLEIEGKIYEIVGVQPIDDGEITDLILKETELVIEPVAKEKTTMANLTETVTLAVLPAYTWVNFPAASFTYSDWQIYHNNIDVSDDFLIREENKVRQIRSSVEYTNLKFIYV